MNNERTPDQAAELSPLDEARFGVRSARARVVTAKNLPAVSGTTGGEKCESYKDCVALIKDGKEIQYVGQSGIGPFNDDHDPGAASIGIYKFDAKNKPVFDHAQQGSVPKG